MEDRIQKAVELFKSGYNCSQSVVAAFAEICMDLHRNRRCVWVLPLVGG